MATTLAAAAAVYLFVPSSHDFRGVDREVSLRLLQFLGEGTFISILSGMRRLSMEQAHRRLEELLVTLRGIGDAVVATDADARVRFLNPVAERLTSLVMMTGSVVRTGFTTVVGTANVAANATNPPSNWEQAARRAGLTEAQVQQMRADLPTAEQARSTSATAAWWSVLGIALSVAAAIGGSVVGAGPRTATGGTLFRRTTYAVGHG